MPPTEEKPREPEAKRERLLQGGARALQVCVNEIDDPPKKKHGTAPV